MTACGPGCLTCRFYHPARLWPTGCASPKSYSAPSACGASPPSTAFACASSPSCATSSPPASLVAPAKSATRTAALLQFGTTATNQAQTHHLWVQGGRFPPENAHLPYHAGEISAVTRSLCKRVGRPVGLPSLRRATLHPPRAHRHMMMRNILGERRLPPLNHSSIKLPATAQAPGSRPGTCVGAIVWRGREIWATIINQQTLYRYLALGRTF